MFQVLDYLPRVPNTFFGVLILSASSVSASVSASFFAFTICATSASAADLSWNFDTQIGNKPDSIEAFIYPNAADPTSAKSPMHVAKLTRPAATTLGTGSVAHLDFTLDGTNYPSAGIGILMPSGQPKDASSLTAISVKVRTDKSRTVTLALVSSKNAAYTALANNGKAYGYGGDVGPTGTTWNISKDMINWPSWCLTSTGTVAAAQTDIAAYVAGGDAKSKVGEVLKGLTAVQIGTACAGAGTCTSDVGVIEIDDLTLTGVSSTGIVHEWHLKPSRHRIAQGQGVTIWLGDAMALKPSETSFLLGRALP